ncbi:7-cyano-7-deazaguanine synthase [Kutzneria albida]|uniref:7-cyano-7-deazaguanine synthase n=1 Tax=Kutzneria albida DSM 43870 TaxID=1449976 RepID=W5WBN3_9PSEU|nr:7-cyano-7-deazaguanine synthase [Kutzneria albida]AHH98588.1 hypothetical protein KALB_5226 [Kutzneria albida DSM 43870]
MSNQRSYRYAFTATGKYPATGNWRRVGEADFRSSLQRVRHAVLPAAATPEWADDLLRIARAVYLVDKLSPRPHERDPWTRELCLWVQVTDPDRWLGEPLDRLNTLLRVLTSDVWDVAVAGGALPIDEQQRLGEYGTASEVALFSGGLDSTAYAAQQACTPGGPLLLLGYDMADAQLPQRSLYSAITELDARQRPVNYCGVAATLAKKGRKLEPSTRSRGFLFATTAVYAAAAHGVAQAMVPENGQLAINPPLTPARLAACSTRSVHPWILQQLNELITAVHGSVTVYNPFLYRTKGEVCTAAHANGLSHADLARTVSCGSYSIHRQIGNCGYCYPCLIRRSGLHAALGTDPTDYEHDLHHLSTLKTAQHLLDLHQWLSHEFTAHDLIADMPLPAGTSMYELLAMLQRGRAEIGSMLTASSPWGGICD